MPYRTLEVCPRCKQDAPVVMVRSPDRKLCLYCEECEWAWIDPKDIAIVEKGTLGIYWDVVPANKDDIAQGGWDISEFEVV